MNGTSRKLKAGGNGKVGIHKLCSCSCDSPSNGLHTGVSCVHYSHTIPAIHVTIH